METPKKKNRLKAYLLDVNNSYKTNNVLKNMTLY